MELKKSLEKRIRGWFPKEPNLSKHIQEYTQPTAINQKNITIEPGARKQRTAFLFLIFFLFLLILGLAYFQVGVGFPWEVLAISLVSGLVAGSLASSPIHKRELKLLLQQGEIGPKEMVLSLLALVAFWAIYYLMYPFFSWQIRGIFIDLILGGVLGTFCSIAVLSIRWENTYKKRIYLRFWGGFYALPQNWQANVSNVTFTYTQPNKIAQDQPRGRIGF
jgi:hypothetical protein